MRYSVIVKIAHCWDELSEDIACGFLWELVGHIDNSEELSILLDFHDVVENAKDFAVSCAVDTPYIEVNNLNYISMPSLKWHFDFIEEHLENLLLISSFKLWLSDFLVHDFYGYSLVGGKINAKLNPV